MSRLAAMALPLPLPVPFTLERPWPVHRGSIEKRSIRFQPMHKRRDVSLWFYQFSRWAVVAKAPAGGRAVKAVLRSLIGMMNWQTGRLDPSYETIGKRSDYHRSTVHNALKFLSDLGVIGWIRCCKHSTAKSGRFQLQQESNVYYFNPPSQWAGYVDDRPPPPPPSPDVWGAAYKVPAAEEAFFETKGDPFSTERLAALESDPTNELALTLARLGRARAAALAAKPPD
ncbi:MAG: hypothetical protein HZA67_12035 [Rhodospirillales bacterium]|nr:hypothetical protein [Rhodospirillales bacterium]